MTDTQPIRICPKRDTECPHGYLCPYSISAHECLPDRKATPTDRESVERIKSEAMTLEAHGSLWVHSDDYAALLTTKESADGNLPRSPGHFAGDFTYSRHPRPAQGD